MVSKSELKQEYKRLLQVGKTKEAKALLKQVQNFQSSNNVTIVPRKSSKKSK
jgi:hypothetical protein